MVVKRADGAGGSSHWWTQHRQEQLRGVECSAALEQVMENPEANGRLTWRSHQRNLSSRFRSLDFIFRGQGGIKGFSRGWAGSNCALEIALWLPCVRETG